MNLQMEFDEAFDWFFPVLWRDNVKGLTDPCPFCQQRHTHGIPDGHRIAHCVEEGKYFNRHNTQPPESITVGGTVTMYRSNGYIVKTRNLNTV